MWLLLMITAASAFTHIYFITVFGMIVFLFVDKAENRID